MKDNFRKTTLDCWVVVNCFQKLLSSWWRTTIKRLCQLFICCELLSKIIIFVMKDNQPLRGAGSNEVVNCFQKLLSSWWRTTWLKDLQNFLQLWIAFKNYYLRDEGQPTLSSSERLCCCELLSKIIIFVMKDNKEKRFLKQTYVVNCFQKLLSSWWRTTDIEIDACNLMLWIAFKNYYLRDEGQPRYNHFVEVTRCELLSKIIIFVMKDNYH